MKILKARVFIPITKDLHLGICKSCLGAYIDRDPQHHDRCENSYENPCYCDCWVAQKGLKNGRFVSSE